VRAHVQVTLDDLAQEFAAPHGLRLQSHESAPLMQYVIQHHQSDLELLQQLAQRVGLYFSVREDSLHIFSLSGIDGEALTLRLGETLLEAQFEINADSVVGEVAATGWDSARIETHSGRVSSARSGRSVYASVAAGDVGGSGARSLVNLGVEDALQVEALAQSELDHREAREVVLNGTAQGDTRLRPGASVNAVDVASSVAGTYVLTTATHRISEQVGYITEITSAPPPRRERPRGTIAAPGVVTQIDDPERLGRVRVSLPSFENVNTDWINVVTIGAGAGKGLMIQPDVNDDVLVLLAHEDPAQAVVVGGLYGPNGTPDAGIEDGAVRRYTLLTPGKQRVTLDDSGQVIRLENSDGSFVELSPQKVRVHAERDLEIEAPGKAIVIRGNTIDFERG
jgi:phage baseplate assembly protein gpV